MASRLLRGWFDANPTINQGDIAKAIGMSQSNFSMVVNGARYPSKDYAEKLAGLTGLPVEKLVNPRTVLVVASSERVA